MLISAAKKAVLALFIGLFGSACGGSEFSSSGGKGGADGGGGTSGNSGTGGGGAPSCGSDTGLCAPKTPDGWNGPVLIVKSPDGSATCQADYPTEAFTRMDGLDKTAPTCLCECQNGNVQCNEKGAISFFKDSTCSTSCGGETLATTGCKLTPQLSTYCSGLAGSWKFGATAQGSCSPHQITAIPAPTWAMTVRGCEATSVSTCAGEGTCLPKPPSESARICIWKDGIEGCPSVGYTDGQRLYANSDDQRSCTGSCTCGSPYCGKVTYFSDPSCTSAVGPEAPAPLGVCGGGAAAAAAMAYTEEAGCMPTGDFTAAGEITATDPTSICCLP